MTVSLFTFVNLYDRQLGTLDHLLTKGAEFAKATGVSEAEMLNWRLIDDMQPLRFQIMVMCNFTKQWTARVAGLPVPAEIDQTTSTWPASRPPSPTPRPILRRLRRSSSRAATTCP